MKAVATHPGYLYSVGGMGGGVSSSNYGVCLRVIGIKGEKGVCFTPESSSSRSLSRDNDVNLPAVGISGICSGSVAVVDMLLLEIEVFGLLRSDGSCI